MKIKIVVYQFDEPDQDGDIILMDGIYIERDIPILWNFNPDRLPICVLRKEEAKRLFDSKFSKYRLAPGGIIKKCRKPTTIEKKHNPKLKRIIQEMEIVEFGLIPEDKEYNYVEITLPKPNNGETVTKG